MVAVEAFRTIQKCSATDAGKQRKLDKLVALLDSTSTMWSWRPGCRFADQDMTFGMSQTPSTRATRQRASP